jgi:hypothetical protein
MAAERRQCDRLGVAARLLLLLPGGDRSRVLWRRPWDHAAAL